MIFFWPKVYGPLGKTPYIYPRYQVWGVTDLNFDLAYYHPPLLQHCISADRKIHSIRLHGLGVGNWQGPPLPESVSDTYSEIFFQEICSIVPSF